MRFDFLEEKRCPERGFKGLLAVARVLVCANCAVCIGVNYAPWFSRFLVIVWEGSSPKILRYWVANRPG